MSVLHQSAWAAAAAVVLSGSRFVFVAIVARRLSLSGFGQYAYGQWLADFVFLACSLGATGAISRYLAEFQHAPALLTAVARRWRPFALGLPLLAAALVPVGAVFSGLSLGPQALALLALLTLTSGLWAMQTAALTGLQRFDLILAANVIAAAILIGGALLVPLGVNGPGRVFGLMSLACGCAAAIGASTTLRVTKGAATAIDRAAWRAMGEYAINMWLTALLWNLVWSRGEMPIVKAYLGDAGVARYAAALALFGGAVQGVMLASSGAAPELTRLWGAGTRALAVNLARKIMDTQLLIGGLAAVCLIDFGPELMQMAFGADFRGESASVAILSFGLIAMTISCQNHLLQIATDGRFTRNTTLAGLAVLLATATVLISDLGLHGAAMARAGTMLSMAAVSLFVSRRRWGATAFSRSNVASVVLILAASTAMQLGAADLGWIVRAGTASLAVALLVGVVRDGDGRLQAWVVVERLRRAVFAETAVAGRGERR